MTKHSETVQIFFLIFSGLLMTILFLSKVLHDAPRVNSILSEPAMTLLVGMTFSLIVSIFFVFKEENNEQDFNGNDDYEVEQDLADSILSFQTKVFFLALLPPILFNSGYQLQRELFYRHLAPISLFACVGTCISGFCTGGILISMRNLGLFGYYFYPTNMELLTFGALIAATDTVSVVGVLQAKQVDPHLFSLVFGESALNDAVAIVLFKTLSTFLVQDAFGDRSTLLAATIKFLAHLTVQATCSPLLGMFYAFCIAFAFKTVDLREHKLLELSLYIMPMYIPYMLSEAFELSGMITIFFTGMFAKRYMEPNVSDSTKQHAEMIFKLFAFLAETCIFLELGLSVFGLSGSFQWPFIGCALLTALIGRAASIYPLAAFYNLSLTKVVKICSCGADDTSLSTIDSGSATGSKTSLSGASALSAHTFTTNTSLTAAAASTFSNSRRETPKRRLDKRIPLNFMHMLTFAGLRGAVAYACARDFPNLYSHRDSFVTATMVIVLFTIVIMGGGTEPLMERLKIRTNVDEKEYMRNWHRQRKLKGRFHRFEYHYIYRMVVRQPPPPRPEETERTIRHCMTPIMTNTKIPDNNATNNPFDYSNALNEQNGEEKGTQDRRSWTQYNYQQSMSDPSDPDDAGVIALAGCYAAPALCPMTASPSVPAGAGVDDTNMSSLTIEDSNVFNLYEEGGTTLSRVRDLPVDYVQQLESENDDGIGRDTSLAGDDQSSLGTSLSSFRDKPSPDRSSTDGSIV